MDSDPEMIKSLVGKDNTIDKDRGIVDVNVPESAEAIMGNTYNDDTNNQCTTKTKKNTLELKNIFDMCET